MKRDGWFTFSRFTLLLFHRFPAFIQVFCRFLANLSGVPYRYLTGMFACAWQPGPEMAGFVEAAGGFGVEDEGREARFVWASDVLVAPYKRRGKFFGGHSIFEKIE